MITCGFFESDEIWTVISIPPTITAKNKYKNLHIIDESNQDIYTKC